MGRATDKGDFVFKLISTSLLSVSLLLTGGSALAAPGVGEMVYGARVERGLSEFEARYEEKKHRIRERLLVAARQLSLEDVTDPTLANLRSMAVKIVNEGLGKRMVDSIVVSEFVHAEK